MEKEKKKETPEDAQDNERKTKEKVQKDELKREFKPTKKESETKMQMNKAMLKGNKEERKRRRKDGIYGPQMGFTNIFWNPLLDCVCMLTGLFFLAKFQQKVK